MDRRNQEGGVNRLLTMTAERDLSQALDRLIVEFQVELLPGDLELIGRRRRRRIDRGRRSGAWRGDPG